MSKLKKLLFIYSAILAIFISASGISNVRNIDSALFQLAFLPVPLYFVGSFFGYLIQLKRQKGKESLPLGAGFSLGKGRVMFIIIIFLVLLATSTRRILTSAENPPETEQKREGINIKDYIKEKPKKFVVIKADDASSEINVREEPSTASEILDKVTPEEEYEYKSENEDWFEIVLDEEKTGWIHKDYASIVEENTEE